jgi:hypothetical protein
MSTAVYPIFARGAIDTLTKAMQAEPVEEWAAEAIEQGIGNTQQARRAVERLRQNFEERLRAGMLVQKSLAESEKSLQSSKLTAAELAKQLDRLRNSPLPSKLKELSPKQKEFQSEMEALMREWFAFLDFMSDVLAKAKAPFPPIDWDRVKEVERAYAAGETKPFEWRPKVGAQE